MSKKTHQKQLERARAKRAAERQQQKSTRNRGIAIALILALTGSVFVGVLLTSGGDPEPSVSPPAFPTDPGELPTGSFAAPCDLEGVQDPTSSASPYPEAPSSELNEDVVYRATISTTCGDVVVLMDPRVSPTTVSVFLALADDGYYDGAPFHRVIEGFMIQGGDPTGTGTGNGVFPGYTLAEETDQATALFDIFGGYPRRALAMAKTAAPNSTGSQFFIVQGRVPDFEPATLDPQYTVFGWAVDGMEIVDRIAAGPYRIDNPQLAADPVVITGIEVEEVERPEAGIYPTTLDDPDGPAVGDDPAPSPSPSTSPTT